MHIYSINEVAWCRARLIHHHWHWLPLSRLSRLDQISVLCLCAVGTAGAATAAGKENKPAAGLNPATDILPNALVVLKDVSMVSPRYAPPAED